MMFKLSVFFFLVYYRSYFSFYKILLFRDYDDLMLDLGVEKL